MSLLAALKRRYDRLAATGEVPLAGYSTEKVSFCLVLDSAGTVLGVERLTSEVKGKPIPRPMIVPQGPKRSVNIAANFLWDKTAYALGATKLEGGSKRVAQEHETFRVRQRTALQGTNDRGLLAFLAFVDTWDPVRYPDLRYAEEMRDTNVVFRLDGDGFLHDRPAARDRVAAVASAGTAPEGVCLVTGDRAPIARLHPSIKGVRGAQSSGAALVSFNQSAFTSYGKDQGANAPVSEAVTFGYTAALNGLLSTDRRRVQIGDATVVFWVDLPPAASAEAAEAAEGFELFAAETLGGSGGGEIDEHREGDTLLAALADVAAGRPNPALGKRLDPAARFYILGLSPNAARLSVRFFLDTTVAQFADRLRLHFEALRLEPIPWRGRPPAFWRLLVELAPQRKSENVPGHLAGELTRAVLTGAPYPFPLLTLALTRLRADHEITPLRVALIKAVLHRKGKEIPVSLDLDNKNIGYRLGRLFAALEDAQRAGVGEVNAGIRDRYVGAASATPARVFPMLLRGAQNHLSTARKKNKAGWSFNAEKAIREIVGGIDGIEPFPATLTLDDQGRFFVGYYHQQAYRPRKELPDDEVETEE